MTQIPWTFDSAFACWRLARLHPEEHWRELQATEKYLLKHAPKDFSQAAAILDVVLDQGGDPRSDGLDLKALRRLRTLLVAENHGRSERQAAA